jgi:hypothetical protein
MSAILKNRVPIITSGNTEPPPRWRHQVTRQIKTLSFSVIGLSALLSVGNVSADTDKVTICHKPGTPAEKTLTISKSALQAHLDHGDKKGACGSSDSVGLSVEPVLHDFGSINVDASSADKTFTLINESDSSLQLELIDELGNVTTTIDEDGNVTTAYSKEFRVISDPCSDTTLGTQPSLSAYCQFSMVFEPKLAGVKTLNLPIPYIDEFGNSTSLMLPLEGTGVAIPVPNIGATIMSHDFGEVIIDESSDVQTIRISNSGDADLNIGTISISGDADLVLLFDFCSDVTLSSGANCSIRTQLQPKSVGAKTASISIPSDDPDTATLDLLLEGNGIEPPMPNIEVSKPTSSALEFEETQVGSHSWYKSIIISNTGTAPLEIGQVTLTGNDFELRYDHCSNRTVGVSKRCYMYARFKPKSIGAKTETISIPSNDPDTQTIDVSLSGNAVGWCQGDYEHYFSHWPQTANFGTELVGSSTSIPYQGVYSYVRGCDALRIDTIMPTGDHADEFSVDNSQCYHTSWGDWSYSYCGFKTVFTPTEAGTKNAELTVKFFTADNITKTIPLQAAALDSGQPNLDVSPSSHDFGTITAGAYYYNNYQMFTLKNTGNVNLHLDDIDMIGDNADDFRGHEWSWCAYKGVLYPSEQCNLYMYFMPRTAGSKQAELSIASNDPDTPTLVALSGTAEEPKDCSDENITIESSDHGVWATKTTNNNWWQYTGDSDAWTRLQNPYPAGTPAPNRPTALDVVRIKAGHTIEGIPYATVKVLCIEANATLTSMEPPDSGGYYYPYLGIYATDYIENKGTIRGLHGANEADEATSCSQWYNTSENCAKPGASIYLSVGYSTLARFRNEGSILAGNGGDGKQYGMPGGWVSIYDTGITNTDDIGIIRAGRGGSITGTQSGYGGRGGGVSIWGNDYLISDGIGIYAGNGGNCNPDATEAQYGGNGGNMRLNARYTVDLLAGTFATGKGGTNCEPLGEDGNDGGFNTDPSVLNLSGTNTKIEGGDITIFGGNDWTVNMNNLSETALTATGDIRIAVGPGGTINMTGNSGNILKTDGKVIVFADNILLDDGVKLEDIVDAKGGVVVGPGKVLRDVSVTAPNRIFGEPKAVVPITITLSNGGPEEDTFLLSGTDTEGWTLSNLPDTQILAGLASIQIDLNVTLPATVDATDVITISAISQNDPEANAETQIQVSVIEPKGTATVDEGILGLPGIDTTVNGGEVTIVSADGNIDLSNVGDTKVVTATDDITLAVGPDGVIDLRGNNSQILETTGKVIICAKRDQILPQNVDLKTLVGDFEYCSPKPAYNVSLTGPEDLSKPAGSIVPLRFTLKNEGLKADTYDISAINSLSLPLTIQSLKRVKGLSSVELLMNVRLNTAGGQTDVVTVTATSQMNQNSATKTGSDTVNITITSSGSSGSGSSIGGGSEPCPSTGVISGMCNNRGRVITDAILESDANVSGGTFFGNINSEGTISQATIEAGARLSGGKISGQVISKGELADFEFVGGKLVCEDECKLSGTITNKSKVDGSFINPHFAANANMTGGILEGDISGESDGPAILRNLKIRKGSQLTDVILGEGVELNDDVTLINVSLSANFSMKGGIAKGRLIGDPEAPAKLENTIILADCELSNVRIGSGVQLAKGVQFKGNVRFTHHSAIPDDLELIELLPELLGVPLEGILYPRRADFTADVLDPSDGILSAINELPLFKDNGWVLLQNSETGLFELTVEIDGVNIRAGFLPTSLKKAMASVDFELGPAESLHFFTGTDLDVFTQPALQAPGALQSILSALEIPEFTVQTNGNVRVPSGVEGLWFPIRPNWWTLKIDDDAETGVSIIDSPYISVLLSMVFADSEGNKREQWLCPAVGYPELLYASAEEVNIGACGVVDFVFEDQRYCGVMHYVVQPSTESGDTLEIESLSDLTGNGMDDFVLIYPNDEEQWMFSISCE